MNKIKRPKITLFDRNEEICEAWRHEFYYEEDVDVFCCDLEELSPHECIVSAGNSFGIMDGGIDLAIRDMLGVEVQDFLQWQIIYHYAGQLQVGEGVLINTTNEKFPKLAYVPTMRFPGLIQPGHKNVYNAFLAALNLTQYKAGTNQHKIETVACCGLGGCTGGVSPRDLAREMWQAYYEYFILQDAEKLKEGSY